MIRTLTAAVLLVTALTSCGMAYSSASSTPSSSSSSSQTGTTQISRQNQEQLQVTTRVLRVAVKQAYSSSGQMVPLNNGYEIRIQDGKIESRLPFYGSSTRASLGEDVSIVFDKAPMRDYNEDNSKSMSGKFVRTFRAAGADGDYAVSLTVWDNAKVDITCQNSDRSLMRYEGELLID